jgi:transcriptional regulator of nitric oxide reductase
LHLGFLWLLLGVTLRMQAAEGQETVRREPPSQQVRTWFPRLAQARPLASQPAVRVARDSRNEVLGWIFSTDQVEPVVRGKRGPIEVWVGVGRDGRILGVQVGRHREDRKWFDRIRASFYQAFDGRMADGSTGRPDAVTGATVSSAAMINDVFGACKHVLALPEVQADLHRPDATQQPR